MGTTNSRLERLARRIEAYRIGEIIPSSDLERFQKLLEGSKKFGLLAEISPVSRMLRTESPGDAYYCIAEGELFGVCDAILCYH